ncbi:protein-tyrosine phosphatase-like protein [Rhodocollybia butyracea]|uniref:protein-tyrosine-phosphatase n=1 Tax=Rhodocollybia butyracea TaxID=206335 RepID=A0A9P5PY77_9AGAR|nr:protein-tyrosine phosphatase-like protein [Rhodocollybia butyracea]
MSFVVSTILPGFLFLGPEPTSWEHVRELRELGVRRIVNLAAECGPDDWGLSAGFEKYYKIPMRDTVEEDGIGRGVRVVCELLDHARLHSAPAYVHCKAGKSRSVTAVIAYLIHANHWPLSKAYGFVLERRKGISPNIGFVSELMGFEEEELGGKSGGVSGAAWGGQKGESMPPPATHIHHGYSQSVTEPSTSASFHLSDGGSGSGNNSASSSATASPELNGEYRTGASYLGGSGADARQGSSGPSFPPLSAGGILALGDAAQELEVRDANGRYRHARRAPVNETTLQPMRRVSKAGLESGEFFYGDGKMTWGDVEDEEVVEDSPAPVKEAGV